MFCTEDGPCFPHLPNHLPCSGQQQTQPCSCLLHSRKNYRLLLNVTGETQFTSWFFMDNGDMSPWKHVCSNICFQMQSKLWAKTWWCWYHRLWHFLQSLRKLGSVKECCLIKERLKTSSNNGKLRRQTIIVAVMPYLWKTTVPGFISWILKKQFF